VRLHDAKGDEALAIPFRRTAGFPQAQGLIAYGVQRVQESVHESTCAFHRPASRHRTAHDADAHEMVELDSVAGSAGSVDSEMPRVRS